MYLRCRDTHVDLSPVQSQIDALRSAVSSLEFSRDAVSSNDSSRVGVSLPERLKSNDEEADVVDTPPVVLGYGQTHTDKNIYVYRDLRYSDGTVQRQFLRRIPRVEASRGSHSPALQGPEGENSVSRDAGNPQSVDLVR